MSTITTLATAEGLDVRGAFTPQAEDRALLGGEPIGTLVLLGNAGGRMWSHFAAAPEGGDGAPDPLDRWSRRVIEALAVRLDARALFPFDGPPYLPFQRWAQRAAPVWPSPIGPLIDAEYGLWHAYRGALGLAVALPCPDPPERASPCDSCRERPCLVTCPVGALGEGHYDIPACTDHLRTAAGRDCMEQGCRARRACPVGTRHHPAPEQAAFHMRAFLGARGR